MKSNFQLLATHVCLLLLLSLMEHVAIADEPGVGPLICFRPTLSYQAASASHSKVGFEEFYESVRPCPIGIFRTNQYFYTETVTLTPNQGPTTGAHTNIMTWGYDKVTEQYSESSRWIDITSDCFYDTDDPSHGDPNCGLTYSDLRDQFSILWANYFDQTNPCASYEDLKVPFTRSTKDMFHDRYTMQGCDQYTGEYESYGHYILSSEYQTDDLIDKVKSEMVYPGNWTSGDPSTNVLSAAFDLADDETSASGSKFTFRVSFQTKTNCHYTVKWTQKTDYNNTDCAGAVTTNSSSSLMTKEIEGDGSTQTIEQEIQTPGDGTTISVSDFWVCCGDGCDLRRHNQWRGRKRKWLWIPGRRL